MKVAVQRLAEYLRGRIQYDATNGYTALSPSKGTDGTYTMIVKDGSETGILEVTIREKPIKGER